MIPTRRFLMKYAIIIPDGCADEGQESLGGRTPLEAANVPAMDSVAAAGVVYCIVLALIGGFSQPDMALVWRLIPLDQLRARLRPGTAGQ
jgi:hypothetical protein